MQATGAKVVGRGTPGWQAAVASASPVSSDSSPVPVSHLSLCRPHVLSTDPPYILRPSQMLSFSSSIANIPFNYPNRWATRSTCAVE